MNHIRRRNFGGTLPVLQLFLAKDTPIIVYDNAEKTKCAWLVPTLSVVLHMAYIWARDKDDLLKPLPFADL